VREPVERDVAEIVAPAVEQHEHEQPEHEQPEQLPPPAVSLSPERKLSEPDAQFVKDIATCIGAGTRPLTAALWLGATRRQWRAWKHRRGELYDSLRHAVRAATAHLEMRLQADLAKRSPAQALRGLRPIRDDDPEQPASRSYHASGLYALKRQLPHVLTRIADDTIAPDDLSPLEATARQWRDDVIRDLGGVAAITTTKMALLNAATGSMIIQSSIDSYLFALAGTDGLASRKHRRLFPVVEQRMRIADSLTRQLQALGLDRAKTNATDLQQYIAEKYGGNADNRGVDDEPQGAPETT